MAKTSKQKRGDDSRGADYRVISFDPSLVQIREIDDWLAARDPNLRTDVVKILENGWKISFSWSDHYGVFFLSITGKGTNTSYDGYTVTLRNKSFDRLFSILEYVTGILLADEKIPIPTQRDRDSW